MEALPRTNRILFASLLCLASSVNAQPPLPSATPQALSGGKVPLSEAIALLDVDDPDFEMVFPALLQRNSHWKESAQQVLRKGIERQHLDERAHEWLILIQGFREEPNVNAWLSKTLEDPGRPLYFRKYLLRILILMQVPPPDEWLDTLSRILKVPELTSDALAVIKKHGLRDFDRQVQSIIARKDLPALIRIAAADAIAPRLTFSDDLVAFLTASLDDDPDPVSRLVAARALGGGRLSPAQLKAVAEKLPSLPVTAGLTLVPVFARSRDADVGRALLASLAPSPTVSKLTLPDLDRLLANYPEEIIELSQPIRGEIRKRARTGTEERWRQRIKELPAGSAERGKSIFLNSRAACVTCHRAAGQGGGIGPNLSRIGFLRDSNEILESIVLPSTAILPEFRSYRVTTSSGQSRNGFLVAETSDTIFVREADRRLRHVQRDDVEELTVSSISMMPEGLDQLMTRQDLSDLVEFLQNLR